MPEEFKQTVNLRERMNAAQAKPAGNAPKTSAESKKFPIEAERTVRNARASQAEGIDQVYGESESADLQKITKPSVRRDHGAFFRRAAIAAVIVLAIFAVYWALEKKGKAPTEEKSSGPAWYSVKLINGEIYYGEIADTGADPIILKNVYYNYDQASMSAGEEKKAEGASLRLVKRGNETHGPAGDMDIVRTQVVFMEPLKTDSKVLKAILDYEKK